MEDSRTRLGPLLRARSEDMLPRLFRYIRVTEEARGGAKDDVRQWRRGVGGGGEVELYELQEVFQEPIAY
jgi:hypothetical protein